MHHQMPPVSEVGIKWRETSLIRMLMTMLQFKTPASQGDGCKLPPPPVLHPDFSLGEPSAKWREMTFH